MGLCLSVGIMGVRVADCPLLTKLRQQLMLYEKQDLNTGETGDI